MAGAEEEATMVGGTPGKAQVHPSVPMSSIGGSMRSGFYPIADLWRDDV